jgi:hypothetical protein
MISFLYMFYLMPLLSGKKKSAAKEDMKVKAPELAELSQPDSHSNSDTIINTNSMQSPQPGNLSLSTAQQIQFQ